MRLVDFWRPNFDHRRSGGRLVSRSLSRSLGCAVLGRSVAHSLALQGVQSLRDTWSRSPACKDVITNLSSNPLPEIVGSQIVGPHATK